VDEPAASDEGGSGDGWAGRDDGDGRLVLPRPSMTWLELFYDLVFVAAIVVLSDAFSHDSTWGELGWVSLVFTMVWWVWLLTTLLANRVRADDNRQSLLLVGQMMFIALVAISAGDGVQENNELVGTFYAVVLVFVALMYRRAAVFDPALKAFGRRRQWLLLGTAAIFAVTQFTPTGLFAIPWAVAFGLIVVAAVGQGRLPAGREVIDVDHLIHRFGEFTIIMLGETMVKVGLTAADGTFEAVDGFMLALTFGLVYSVFFQYFSHVPGAGVPPTVRGGRLWVGAHFLLQLGIVGMAVGLAKLTVYESEDLDPTYLLYLAAPVVLIEVMLAALAALDPRRATNHVVWLRLVTAALVAVIGVVGALLDPLGVDVSALAVFVVMLVSARVPTRAGRVVRRRARTEDLPAE
jgi:low temperature requirement protein LtrA